MAAVIRSSARQPSIRVGSGSDVSLSGASSTGVYLQTNAPSSACSVVDTLVWIRISP
jgi:hypothetical protein